MPVRRLKKNYQNVTGLFYSNLLRRLVQFDSILERDFILLLDVHPAVRWFAEQPMRIRYRDGEGLDQIYVPDFLIHFEASCFMGKCARRPWIVETKYRSDLIAKWPKIRPKLRAGFREAHRRNSQFHIVTESCLSTIPLANARFLRRFMNIDLPEVLLNELTNWVRKSGRMTVGDVLSSPGLGRQVGNVGQVIWAAVAKRMVAAEFDIPLGLETAIWVR